MHRLTHRVLPGLPSRPGSYLDGGAGGGGGGGDADALKKLREFVDAETAGIRSNREAILREKETLDGELRKLKEQVAGLGDLDAIKRFMADLQSDKEKQLIKDGKIDEVVSLRTQALRADLEAKVNAATAKIDELTQQLSGKTSRIKRLLIDNKVHALLPADVEKTAVPDVIREAHEIFDVDDSDNLVARNGDGVALFGKDGKSPLSLDEWLESDRTRAPHRYARATGGGAGGGGGAKPKKGEDAEGMSSRQKLASAIGAGVA